MQEHQYFWLTAIESETDELQSMEEEMISTQKSWGGEI